jgi:hypothetical protein
MVRSVTGNRIVPNDVPDELQSDRLRAKSVSRGEDTRDFHRHENNRKHEGDAPADGSQNDSGILEQGKGSIKLNALEG